MPGSSIGISLDSFVDELVKGFRVTFTANGKRQFVQ